MGRGSARRPSSVSYDGWHVRKLRSGPADHPTGLRNCCRGTFPISVHPRPSAVFLSGDSRFAKPTLARKVPEIGPRHRVKCPLSARELRSPVSSYLTAADANRALDEPRRHDEHDGKSRLYGVVILVPSWFHPFPSWRTWRPWRFNTRLSVLLSAATPFFDIQKNPLRRGRRSAPSAATRSRAVLLPSRKRERPELKRRRRRRTPDAHQDYAIASSPARGDML
jgi:hypothetical protein